MGFLRTTIKYPKHRFLPSWLDEPASFSPETWTHSGGGHTQRFKTLSANQAKTKITSDFELYVVYLYMIIMTI